MNEEIIHYERGKDMDFNKAIHAGRKIHCHACGQMGESRMCLTDIPYFKVYFFFLYLILLGSYYHVFCM